VLTSTGEVSWDETAHSNEEAAVVTEGVRRKLQVAGCGEESKIG
jgi:hypothetical protein